MRGLTRRLTFLFCTTKGLMLAAIAMIAITTAIWSTLSGPLASMGAKDAIVRILGMRLVAAEREGRIIMLYHSIAMAVVAIEVYLITALLPMKRQLHAAINGTITVGYMTSLVFGLLFAYFGRNWAFHGLFLFGQSLVFFAGAMLAVGLWPWQKEYRVKDLAYAHGPGRVDLERVAFFVVAVATLASVLFGAIPGSFFGNGFESFLAENVVREPHKTGLQLAVIGHLHIMLTLIAIALALIVGRSLDFKGPLHKVAMPLMILGTIVVTLGVWMVVPFEELAHFIIYGGSVPAAFAALFLVIFGWRKIIRDRLAEQGIQKATFSQGLSALVHDPLKFGQLWQMVYMNFVVTFVGIFSAVRLDEIIRVWPAREERILLTGHWHILSAIIATILLLYYVDLVGLKGRARRWFGWAVIVGSNVAFGAVVLFATKRLYVAESAQQNLVTWSMLLTDAGLALLMVTLAALMVWRLADLFKKRGRWAKELSDTDQEVLP